MSARFDVRELSLGGLALLTRKPLADDRGWLERMYDAGDLAPLLGARKLAQVNRTVTRARGTVRGLHYQVAPGQEAKLVSCLRGEIFDVAVDLRRGSPTYLSWHAEILSADNRATLLIPEGFAHGFQAMVDDCELLYCHTAAYSPAAERGIHPEDPRVGIDWPNAVSNLSPRDAGHPPLDAEFEGIES